MTVSRTQTTSIAALALALALASAQGAPLAAVQQCGGDSSLDETASWCAVYPNRTVELSTRWRVPRAVSAAPLKMTVQNIMSFALDACGNHTTQIAGGVVSVRVAGLPCPAAAGDHSVGLRVALPAFVPHGTYRIQMDGGAVLCAAVTVEL